MANAFSLSWVMVFRIKVWILFKLPLSSSPYKANSKAPQNFTVYYSGQDVSKYCHLYIVPSNGNPVAFTLLIAFSRWLWPFEFLSSRPIFLGQGLGVWDCKSDQIFLFHSPIRGVQQSTDWLRLLWKKKKKLITGNTSLVSPWRHEMYMQV